VELAKSLHIKGARLTGFDPVVKSIPKSLAKIIKLKQSVADAIRDADVVIIAVEWPEFLQWGEDIINLMKNKMIIDPNGFISKLALSNNLNYVSVGKSLQRGA
jgi:UDP-glucose 6-dehydrogenase